MGESLGVREGKWPFPTLSLWISPVRRSSLFPGSQASRLITFVQLSHQLGGASTPEEGLGQSMKSIRVVVLQSAPPLHQAA